MATGVWRRVATGAVLSVVVLAAVGSAAAAKLVTLPVWGNVVLGAATFGAGLFLGPLTRRTESWIDLPRQRREVLARHLRMRTGTGDVQRVRACRDAKRLGVHRAATAERMGPTEDLPPYVEREVQAQVREAFGTGGLVVIEGPSAAGKSRLAFEAMHAYGPRRWLIVPETTQSLRALREAGVPVKDAVIWLDDVDNYLASGGLDAGVLDALCPHGRSDVVVLATLRTEARRNLAAPDLESSVKAAVEDFFRRARLVPLDRTLTSVEREGAERLRDDPRIASALDDSGPVGFAEHLAAAPATLDRWHAARRGEHPVAGAIISAAVDARRAGYLSPIPRRLLEDLHGHYLDQRDLHHPNRSTFAESLTWASDPVKGASACLNPAGDGCYDPFDYLIEHTQQASSGADIPDALWDTIVEAAPITDLTSIGIRAYQIHKMPTSEAAFRRDADAGNNIAMYNLGVLLADSGQGEEAEQWYRRAADAGHYGAMSNLGLLLAKAGQGEEAEEWYRHAADAGHYTAMSNLGNLLAGTGRREEAEHWYRRAAHAGHHDAMSNLGVLLKGSGRAEEAEQWYRRAAHAGHYGAMSNLGNLLADKGWVEEAEQWYYRAADAGHYGAMFNLGALLADTGRGEEAEKWYRRAADADNSDAMFNLGLLLADTGRSEEAEQWYRRAADADNSDAMFNLGLLLADTGRGEEAEKWYQRAKLTGEDDTGVATGR